MFSEIGMYSLNMIGLIAILKKCQNIKKAAYLFLLQNKMTGQNSKYNELIKSSKFSPNIMYCL